MRYSFYTFATMAWSLLLCAGCDDKLPPLASPKITPSHSVAGVLIDKWIGKWNGPEGTYLQISGQQGTYEIIINNLDGPRSFQGEAVGNQIIFMRDGVKESIRSTNGKETGMKWLSENINCLTVRAGEGYCRN